MTDNTAVNDARALLREFQRSKLRACHLRTNAMELFLTRDPALRPPARAAPTAPAAEPPVLAHLTAPHLATLVEMLAVGSAVSAGTTLARIALLEEEILLHAEHDGVVAAHHATQGDLLEYGQRILHLAAHPG